MGLPIFVVTARRLLSRERKTTPPDKRSPRKKVEGRTKRSQ
jgi:hypothetical protein